MHFEKKDDILMELTKTAENKTENDAWLSLVERYVRDVEVAGSNPVTPIFSCKNMGFSGGGKAIFKQMFVLLGVTSWT